MAERQSSEQGRRAWERGRQGDFAGLERVVLRLEASGTAAGLLWASALRALLWTAESKGSAPIDVASMQDAISSLAADDDDASAAASFACVEGARWALLSLDFPKWSSWVFTGNQLVERAPTAEARRAQLWLRGWSAIHAGDGNAAAEDAATLEGEAASAGDAAMVVEAAAQRTMALISAGDLDGGTRHARRTSRMARTEALPQQEYLAHLLLARLRRMTGHPHLATRILRALAPVASPLWLPWVGWELIMAGALEAAAEMRPMPSGRATELTAALRALTESAEASNRQGFDEAAGRLTSFEGFPAFETDIETTLAACDVRRPLLGEHLPDWAWGHTNQAPPPLHGLLTRPGSAPEGDSAIAYAISHPETGQRRIPRLGYGLVSLPELVTLEQTRRKQGRVETLVSALLLAGDEGYDETRLFSTVYGFEYEPSTHKGVFDVLLHRARSYLGDHGELHRSDGWIRLELSRPLMVPDPRCAKPIEDRLLRAVAEQRGATAKDVANAVGVSLRAAQAALHELAEKGACQAERDGRQLRYQIEDTTFSEPTYHGPEGR